MVGECSIRFFSSLFSMHADLVGRVGHSHSVNGIHWPSARYDCFACNAYGKCNQEVCTQRRLKKATEHCLPGTRIVDFAVWLAFELVLSVLDLMKEWKKIKATL